MANKQNIIIHLDGINACESKDYDQALKLFMRISEPSAAIFFNMGCCYLKLKENSNALKMFRECVTRDKYLAIGLFQLAVAQTLCGDLTSAADSFQEAFTTLRGNPFIDYKQLNMACKLYASEVNFNLGLVYLFSGDYNAARDYIRYAGGLQTDSSRHSAIPAGVDAVERERWAYFGREASERLIMLPENCFFRVSKAKMEGLQTSTKFMAEAKVVAAVNDDYDFVGFVGAKKLQAASNATPSSPTPKRSSAAVGPPPSVPPPRLPPGVTSPTRNARSPVPGMPQTISAAKTSPTRRASPSRPPPPSAPPPKSINKGPPSKPPPMREISPSKSPNTGRSTPASGSGNVMSELRKTMENVRFKPVETPADKSNRPAPYTNVVKKGALTNDVQRGSPTFPRAQPTMTTLNCEFKVNIPADISYEELLKKIAEKLRQASSDLLNPLRQTSMAIALEDPSKKTKVAITSESSLWRPSWSSMMKNRQSEPILTLKEPEKESYQHGVSTSSSSTVPSASSVGYNNFRPTPTLVEPENDEEYGDDIYHDIS